jgi:hypothetical protein
MAAHLSDSTPFDSVREMLDIMGSSDESTLSFRVSAAYTLLDVLHPKERADWVRADGVVLRERYTALMAKPVKVGGFRV